MIKQAHDKLFKETFGSIEIAKDFMENYLPESVLGLVNLETLEPQKDSFINKKLQEVFSDLLFKVDINKEEGYIYFLFEHKSYKDRLVIFQLLRYMIEIWESKIKKENNNKIPIIIPLLVYHDQGKWDIKTSLGEMIPGYNGLSDDIKKYIPHFEYMVFDLTKYKDEDVKLESITRIVVKILKDVRYADKSRVLDIFTEGMELLKRISEKDTVTHYLESCLRYILSVRNDIEKDEMVKIAGKISVEGSELVMTVAERLIEEGMEKGMEKGMERVAKNAIIKGMKVEDILELTGLTEGDIERIRKEMIN